MDYPAKLYISIVGTILKLVPRKGFLVALIVDTYITINATFYFIN